MSALAAMHTLQIAIFVRFQFGIIRTEEVADAQQQIKRARFLVDSLEFVEEHLEIASNIAAHQANAPRTQHRKKRSIIGRALK